MITRPRNKRVIGASKRRKHNRFRLLFGKLLSLSLSISNLPDMSLSVQFAPVLATLAQPFKRQADTLLDLHECVQTKTKPGRCVRCYFALHENSAESAISRLCPLRTWLEDHIEIVAHDEEARLLETLPLRLEEASDLESYCHRVMEEFRDNRAYQTSRINIGFRYREPAGAAA